MLVNAKKLPGYIEHSQCTEAQKRGAELVKGLHDRIEVIAYQSFAEIVQQLKITGNLISTEQSDQILAFIKKRAHLELYRPDGYWKSRLRLLDADGSQVSILIKEQFEKQVNGLSRLIHDRDTKLTDARYHSLTDLLMAMDDHNYMVKENLLRSWYKCSDKKHAPGREILEEAKSKAEFYKSMNKQLQFDLGVSLKERQAFFDQYFPRIREPEFGREFMEVIELRDYFGGDQVLFNPTSKTLEIVTPKGKFSVDVSKPNVKLTKVLNPEDIQGLFHKRDVSNLVRKATLVLNPILSDKSVTVEKFMETYFPEFGYKKRVARYASLAPSRSYYLITVAVATAVALIGSAFGVFKRNNARLQN